MTDVFPAPRKPLSSVTGRRGSLDFLILCGRSFWRFESLGDDFDSLGDFFFPLGEGSFFAFLALADFVAPIVL